MLYNRAGIVNRTEAMDAGGKARYTVGFQGFRVFLAEQT